MDHSALSLLWLTSVLLVLPALAGTAALFEVARLRARGDDPSTGRAFLVALRHYLAASTALGLPWLAVGGLLALDIAILGQLTPPVAGPLLVVLAALALLYLLASTALFPVLVSHAAPPSRLARTTMLVTLLAPGRAVLGGTVLGLAVAAVWLVPLAVIVAPSLAAAGLIRLYQPAFRRLAGRIESTPARGHRSLAVPDPA